MGVLGKLFGVEGKRREKKRGTTKITVSEPKSEMLHMFNRTVEIRSVQCIGEKNFLSLTLFRCGNNVQILHEIRPMLRALRE